MGIRYFVVGHHPNGGWGVSLEDTDEPASVVIPEVSKQYLSYEGAYNGTCEEALCMGLCRSKDPYDPMPFVWPLESIHGVRLRQSQNLLVE